MSKFFPSGHRVLIKQDIVEKTTQSGIIVAVDTKTEQSATDTGEIVSIGKDAWNGLGDGKPWAKVGDKVGFVRYSGKVITDKDDKDIIYLVMNDEDIVVNYTEEVKK